MSEAGKIIINIDGKRQLKTAGQAVEAADDTLPCDPCDGGIVMGSIGLCPDCGPSGMPLKWVFTIRKRMEKEVPPEFRTAPPTQVAGPSLEHLQFIEDGTVTQELYLNLMMKAIDTRHQDEAHVAYPRIIADLSPLEAFLLYDIAQEPHRTLSDRVPSTYATEGLLRNTFPQYARLTRAQLLAALDHLVALKLVNNGEHECESPLPHSRYLDVFVEISYFGEDFIRVCMPNKERVEEIRKAQMGATPTPDAQRS